MHFPLIARLTRRISRLTRRVGGLFVLTVAAVAVLAGPASAHNSLVSSDPAEGVTVATSPATATLTFQNYVALETLTVRVQSNAGVSTVGNARLEPQNQKVVIVPVSPITGPVAVRWRLVGADGHAITGVVKYSVAAAVEAVPDQSGATTSATTRSNGQSSPEILPDVAEDTGLPGSLRWVLRMIAYVAMFVAVGLVSTDMFIWDGTLRRAAMRRALFGSICLAMTASALQMFVLAGDIGRATAWAPAWSTDAGVGLLVRVGALALLLVLCLVNVSMEPFERDAGILLLLAVAFAGWSLGGHAKSMRWPAVGITLDVVHHFAAATWIGGLCVLALLVIPRTSLSVSVGVVRRFAEVAPVCVSVVSATGLVQTFRLAGGLSGLFSVRHGQLLLAKLALLGVVLGVAELNRRRVASWLSSDATTTDVSVLRRSMRVEMLAGAAVIAVTAAMVVSPPGVARTTLPPVAAFTVSS